jgi:hypothetical protein
METVSSKIRKMEHRCTELEDWILTNSPRCLTEGKHRVAGTRDRGYWAYGYLTALQDVMRLLLRDAAAWQSSEGDKSRTDYAA